MGVNRLWVFPRRLRSAPERILLLTDPTLAFVARSPPDTVALVHDLTPLTEFADRRDSTWMFRAILPRLRRMRLVVVTTDLMRSELIARGVDANRVRVVPYTHGLGFHPDHPAHSMERMARTGQIRLLYVATDRPFKNLGFVVQLAQALNADQLGPRFPITILSRVRPETARRLAELKLANLQVVPEVPRMEELYEEHDVLIYPSLHEGFGRPLIEALAYGMPVVANRIRPLTDILGDAGIFLGVGSVDPWVSALLSLREPSLFARHAQRALERGQLFLPDHFQRSVNEAFRSLLG
jgi:glycosyltransferase involved in cell wall biosynthesis